MCDEVSMMEEEREEEGQGRRERESKDIVHFFR